MKLKELGEFGFIDRIAPLGNVRSKGVVKGIGDDCAVIDCGLPEYLLVTTDLLVERVHFVSDWAQPEVFGSKALAVNLSDIAACGGVPRDAFISLAVPEHYEVEWLDRLYRGMSDLAHEHDVNLLGGDTTSSKSDLIINVAVTGSVPKHEVLYRHTAEVGDRIVLTGHSGDSAAGLEILLHAPDLPAELSDKLISAHLNPTPHVAQGRLLAESGACSAAIDVSDGISSDLGHLCQDSGIGAVIEESALPRSPELVSAARALGKEPLDWILHGGEAYVLLAAVKPDGLEDLEKAFSERGLDLFPIGECVPGNRMHIRKQDGSLEPFIAGGWNHFA